MAARRRVFSPAILVRRKALYDGVLGSSTLWKGIAVVVFGKSVLRRIVGRQPEVIGTERLTAGQWIRIEALAPEPRRGGRRARRRAS